MKAIEQPHAGNGALTEEQFARLETWYRIISQRDGTAERRVWHWQLVAAALIAIVLGVGIWDHLDPRAEVRAFVQVVQVNEDGQIQHLGLPQDLLAYTPQDAQWLDMLSEWVRRVRWRGNDPVKAQADWNWARAHLCGRQVMHLFDEMEQREKPFTDLGRRLVAVEIKAATATPVPLTFHVFWEETTTDFTLQRTKPYTGTFSVGRLQPANQAMLMHNRLGLCIKALNISEQPS